jgi:DNA polymerase V
MLPNRNIIVIDLKSFFASCECVERHLDPFKIDLVVANPNQGNGAITLAITPHLKAQGIKSRTRLYAIPKNIKYTIVPPRMSLYLKKSKEVVNIFLNYVAIEDLHVYSVDESFLDLTNYLKMYKHTDYEMAEIIMQDIYKHTGLTATCGIGPNMLLAKIAMDTEAKKYKNGIAKWTYDDVETKLWNINPLSKMWGIGPRMEKRLNALNIYSVGDLAKYNKLKLKDKFGIMGEELWNHANGIDLSIISDYKVKPKNISYSHSQVLFKDYNETNVKLIIKEMIDVVCARLRKNHKAATIIGLGIGYSKTYGGGFYHVAKVKSTDLEDDFLSNAINIFDSYYHDEPIRKVSIVAGGLVNSDSVQLNIFEDIQKVEEHEKFNQAIDEVKEKYGKNSILKASSLLSDSTARERNEKIGGHHA